jgi:tetratricopeptide (TPR) repeat protein
MNEELLTQSDNWQNLLRAISFTESGSFSLFILLLSDGSLEPVLRKALKQDHQLSTLRVKTPSALRKLTGKLLNKPVAKHHDVLWVSVTAPNLTNRSHWEEAWRFALARLNENRNPITAKWNLPVILVGPPWLSEAFRDVAPDFWSIRSHVFSISLKSTDFRENFSVYINSELPSFHGDINIPLNELERLRNMPGTEKPQAEQLLRIASVFLDNQDYESAQQSLIKSNQLSESFNAYFYLGGIELAKSNINTSRGYYKQALLLADQSKQHFLKSISLHQLAVLEQAQGNFDEARRLYQQSIQIQQDLGNKSGITATLHQVAMMEQAQGNLDEARRLYQQSIQIQQDLGNKSGIASTLHQLAMMEQDQGNLDEARRLYQQSIQIQQDLGNKSGIAATLHQLAMMEQAQGNLDEARRLYQQSIQIKQDLGNKSGIASTLHAMGTMEQAQGNLDEARRLYQQSIQIQQDLGNKSGIASTLGQLGKLEQELGNFEQSLQNYISALVLFMQLQSPYASLAVRLIISVRVAAGETEFMQWLQQILPEQWQDLLQLLDASQSAQRQAQ